MKKKPYVYAKLSKRDYLLFRVQGTGLGNILFPYARSIVYAKKHNCEVIWPTWPCVMIFTVIYHERDKRFYHNLFKNKSHYINGLRKIWYMLTKKKISEKDAIKNGNKVEDGVIVFEGLDGCFEDILSDSKFVYDDICKNLRKRNLPALEFDGHKSICMHVRLGDFTRASLEALRAGNHNSSIPIDWYVTMAKELRSIVNKDVKIYVFSDGTDEELKPLLSLENVERKTMGTAIGDILALSNAGVFVASGSSFSMWARYLGRMTTIMFPCQEKQKILFDYEENKEISTENTIPEEYHNLIKSRLL